MSQKYTKEFKETIVQLHEAGQPVSDLVKEYGVANQTIYKQLQLYGKSKDQNVSLHELQQMRTRDFLENNVEDYSKLSTDEKLLLQYIYNTGEQMTTKKPQNYWGGVCHIHQKC